MKKYLIILFLINSVTSFSEQNKESYFTETSIAAIVGGQAIIFLADRDVPLETAVSTEDTQKRANVLQSLKKGEVLHIIVMDDVEKIRNSGVQINTRLAELDKKIRAETNLQKRLALEKREVLLRQQINLIKEAEQAAINRKPLRISYRQVDAATVTLYAQGALKSSQVTIVHSPARIARIEKTLNGITKVGSAVRNVGLITLPVSLGIETYYTHDNRPRTSAQAQQKASMIKVKNGVD